MAQVDPSYLKIFLTCAQVRSSMEMLSGICQWHAPKYLDGNQWGWFPKNGWDKHASMKIILPKPQDAAYGTAKNCPGFELSCSRHMRTGLPTGDIIEYLESHRKMMTRICKNLQVLVKMDIFTQNQFQRLFQLFHSKDYSECMSKCVKPFQTFTKHKPVKVGSQKRRGGMTNLQLNANFLEPIQCSNAHVNSEDSEDSQL